MQFSPLAFFGLLLASTGIIAADGPPPASSFDTSLSRTWAIATAPTDPLSSPSPASASAPTASASGKPAPVSEWALTRATRSRDEHNATCEWALSIQDEPSGAAPELCRFTVRARGEEGCDRVQFANIPCGPDSDWVMNGGFSDFQSFMVVIVYNVREQAKAYFGFESTALDRGEPIPKQIAPAFSTRPQEGQRSR